VIQNDRLVIHSILVFITSDYCTHYLCNSLHIGQNFFKSYHLIGFTFSIFFLRLSLIHATKYIELLHFRHFMISHCYFGTTIFYVQMNTQYMFEILINLFILKDPRNNERD